MKACDLIDSNLPFPIAIGGIGGSGTRLIASFLREVGISMGSDLNASEDCLWFTLLFKRLDMPGCDDEEFGLAASALISGLKGGSPINQSTLALVEKLARTDRLQHSAGWLSERADSLVRSASRPATQARLGWKEPNTHMVIERLWNHIPTLRYVHVVRNGIDMAFSENQNQLELWGAAVLGKNGMLTPERSLSYWCRIHQKLQETQLRNPTRMYWLDFDAICKDPGPGIAKLCQFLEIEGAGIDRLKSLVRYSPKQNRSQDGLAFDVADLSYVRSLGYVF